MQRMMHRSHVGDNRVVSADRVAALVTAYLAGPDSHHCEMKAAQTWQGCSLWHLVVQCYVVNWCDLSPWLCVFGL